MIFFLLKIDMDDVLVSFRKENLILRSECIPAPVKLLQIEVVYSEKWGEIEALMFHDSVFVFRESIVYKVSLEITE